MIDKFGLDEKVMAFHDLVSMKEKLTSLPKPNFIGVGAGRCGTSAIYAALKKHKGCHLSPLKEVNYFGIRNNESKHTGLSYSEYLNYFVGAEEGQVIGEISPAYLTYPESRQYLLKHLPDAKIIITLRNPLTRFVSQFKHHKELHKFDALEDYIKVALEQYNDNLPNGKNWFAPVKNIYQSLYYEGVKFFLENYAKDKVFILMHEDLVNDYTKTMSNLQKFLEIEFIELDNIYTNQSEAGQLKLDVKPSVLNEIKDIFRLDLQKLNKDFNIQVPLD
jgi:hypothetical protein